MLRNLTILAIMLAFGEISSNLPYSLNSLHSANFPLCWYPSLELIRPNFGLWRNIVKCAIFFKCAAFHSCRIRCFPGTLLLSSFARILALAKNRQIRHFRQICCIHRIHHFADTLLLRLFACIWPLGKYLQIRHFSPILPNLPHSSNSSLC